MSGKYHLGRERAGELLQPAGVSAVAATATADPCAGLGRQLRPNTFHGGRQTECCSFTLATAMSIKETSKGFVQTPTWLVDEMVGELFGLAPPRPTDTLLDPGCGRGDFIAGVLRYCRRNSIAPPNIVGIELDGNRFREAAQRFERTQGVTMLRGDYLRTTSLPAELAPFAHPTLSGKQLSTAAPPSPRKHYCCRMTKMESFSRRLNLAL